MTGRTIMIAHPSPDLYGSDLQLLVTIDALTKAGHRIVVVVPENGPLVQRLEERGARAVVMGFPVLRKSALHPKRLAALALEGLRGTLRARNLMREVQGELLLVNTLTLPTWLLAGRLERLPVVSHVHEAEEDQSPLVRLVLAGQLLLANAIITNSHAARRALTDVVPMLDGRITLIHNGVPGPPVALPRLRARSASDPLCAVLVGRLSPRKGIDVALEAVAALRSEGRDVHLDLCGTAFPGYEWYERELRERAEEPDLVGSVTFHGYVSPTWTLLADADVVLVPSRVEPFGNAAVEAMHAGRPLIASGTQGLLEVVKDGETGILVPPGDPDALTKALRRLADNPALGAELASAAKVDAHRRFAPETYAAAVMGVVRSVLQRLPLD